MCFVLFSNLYVQFPFQYRADNKGFLKTILSDDSKIKRRRQKAINLQMTMIAWGLEFITGILAFTIRHFNLKDGGILSGLILLDVGLNFIVIPSSYILNTEVVKDSIIAKGWCKCFNNSHRSTRVEPARNEDLEAPIALHPIPKPISTISGNLNALSNSFDHTTLLNNLTKIADKKLDQNQCIVQVQVHAPE